MTKRIFNELQDAWKHLTEAQRFEIVRRKALGESISQIACRASLTRSFVHSYVRKLNSAF